MSDTIADRVQLLIAKHHKLAESFRRYDPEARAEKEALAAEVDALWLDAKHVEAAATLAAESARGKAIEQEHAEWVARGEMLREHNRNIETILREGLAAIAKAVEGARR